MPVEQQIEAIMWSIGVGLAFFFATWLLVSNAWWQRATDDKIPETDTKPSPIGMVEEYPEGLAEAHGKPTLFLKVLIGGFVVWTIWYVSLFFTGAYGG